MMMKNTLMMGTMFVAGMAVVSSSFAFRGNEEVTAALEANDYSAFVQVAPERLLEKIDSEEAFEALVAHKAEKKALHEEKKAAVEAAVSANDLEAFEAVHENFKAQFEALRPEDAPEKPELTEEQEAERALKKAEKFSELVDYYNENGVLPERSERRGKRGSGKRGQNDGEGRGERGLRGQSELSQE